MFKKILDEVWAFDAEWIPDVAAGRRLYSEGVYYPTAHLADLDRDGKLKTQPLPANADDATIMQYMWDQFRRPDRSLEEEPRPYLKTILCRIVSVSFVKRRKSMTSPSPELQLVSLPLTKDLNNKDLFQKTEAEIITRFLDEIGKRQVQLVGFNSEGADLKIFIQRAVVNGVQSLHFNKRPEKPWEGNDYWSGASDAHVDLQKILAGWSSSGAPSLHQAAVLSGIPGKMSNTGDDVALLWLAGRYDDIIKYNEFDALTTYLLWLRIAYFGGQFGSLAEYQVEQNAVEDLIRRLVFKQPERYAHLQMFLDKWIELRGY